MASIRDVAIKAGVGIGTVSRALNDSGYISEDTKKRIMDAVEELGYQPNELAQNLSRNRSGFIGVMVRDLAHPFSAALMKCMEMELYRHGYRCMMCDIDQKQSRQDEFIEMLQRNVMDGLISCVELLSDRDMSEIHRPSVVLDQDWGKGIPVVHSNHAKGGEIAAWALLESREHFHYNRVLQFVPMDPEEGLYAARHLSFERVMADQGIEVLNIPLARNYERFEEEIHRIRQYVPYLKEVDGVFGDDISALACLKQAGRTGVRVPEDLRLVGYDGLSINRLVYPELTTVRQDIPELARLCVHALLQQIAGAKNVKQEYVADVIFQKGGTS